ncbi:hypothetical protein H0H87_008868 [Tephrocybe sp. NHM501043]|nr:hypothetical protein H0H87_008868 [Tephrocybe sp. NHM501043]
MHIFRGKLDFFNYATNEAITVIVPKSFQPGEPVYLFWKWTKVPSASANPHFFDVGTFAVEPMNGMTKIVFLHSQYHFDTIFSYDFRSLVLRARLVDGRASQYPIVLSSVYRDDVSTPVLFCGSLSCHVAQSVHGAQISAADEMFLLVAPHAFTNRQPFFVLSQWSLDDNATKTNIDCLDRIQSVNEMLKFAFWHGDDYFFEGQLSRDGTQVTATMKSSKYASLLHSFVLEQIQPTAQPHVFSGTVTSTIKNDTEEVVHCTLIQAGSDSTHDWLWTLGGLATSLAGFPGLLPKILNLLRIARKVATTLKESALVSFTGDFGTVGGIVAGSLSVKDLWESDGAIVSKALTPGESNQSPFP